MGYVWEKCGRWGVSGSWQEMMETVLWEDGEGQEWLRKLERFREGDSGEEGWKGDQGENGRE